jgi:hypothetical protein
VRRIVVLACLLVFGCWLVPALAAASSLRWSGPRLVDRAQPFGHWQAFGGVSCPSASLCVAVDFAGEVITSTDPAGVGGWRVADVDPGSFFLGVECPSVSLCVAFDGSGNVVTSTEPTGGAGAWAVAHVDAGLVSGLSSTSLAGLSCPSVSLCVGFDSAGNVVSSTDPAGGAEAWRLAHVDGGNALRSLSCPSVSLCVGFDDAGNVVSSTEPAGGVGAWQVTRIVASQHSLLGLSCPSVSLCVASDREGNVITATDPAGGTGAWTAALVDPGSYVAGINCQSVSLCVAIDGDGRAVTSSDPAGGAQFWDRTTTPVDDGVSANGVSALSCLSVSECVEFDGFGDVVATGDPTGGQERGRKPDRWVCHGCVAAPDAVRPSRRWRVRRRHCA